MRAILSNFIPIINEDTTKNILNAYKPSHEARAEHSFLLLYESKNSRVIPYKVARVYKKLQSDIDPAVPSRVIAQFEGYWDTFLTPFIMNKIVFHFGIRGNTAPRHKKAGYE